MRKGPMARDGSFENLEDPCGWNREKGEHGEGKLERWAETSQEDFRILIFTLKSRKKALKNLK